MYKPKLPKSGLIPPKFDPRRFSYTRTYGSFPINLVPSDFIVGEPTLYNQGFNDICSAVTTSYASELQEGVPLSPEYAFQKTKLLMGNYKSFGADPDTACKAQIKFGDIQRSDSPFSLSVQGRDFIANPQNWDIKLDDKAKEHKKQSYFSIF